MIECIKFKNVEKNTMQGYADFFIHKWGIELHGCTLHMKDGKRWLNLPCKEYSVNGDKRFAPIFRFRNNDHYNKFCDLAKEAIDRYCMKNPPEENKQDEGVPF